MRDLGQKNFSSTGKITIPRGFLRVFIVVVIVLAVILLVKSRFSSSSGSASGMVLQDAPRNLTPVALDGSKLEVKGGVDLTTQEASMRDVMYGGQATATVTRSFGGGSYILSVDADIPKPQNKLYGIFLVSDSGIILVDYMEGNGLDTHYSFRLKDTDKFSGYNTIWITLQRTKGPRPEEHVLEGNFR